MAQPTSPRSVDAVHAYAAELHRLMNRLRIDPLDETTSIQLIDHILSNRATAADMANRQFDSTAAVVH